MKALLNGPAAQEAAPPPRPDAEERPDSKPAAAKPKEGDKAPGFRLHSGPPDYEKYRYGYPPTPGYMFGSGN
jgi:hypothetical protein